MQKKKRMQWDFGGGGQLLEELEKASLWSLSWNLTQKCPLPGGGDRTCPLAEGRAHVSKTENGMGASVGRTLGMNG